MAGEREEEAGDRVEAAPIAVTVTLTERDLIAAMVSTIHRRTRVLLWLIAALLVLLALMTALGLGIGADFAGVEGFLAQLWPLYVAMALIALLIPITLWQTARRQLRSSSELAKPHTFRFYQDGFEAESAHSRGSGDWDAIHEVRELKNLLVLYRSKDVFHLLPKRDFESEAQLEALRTLLVDRLGDRAKVARSRAR